MINVLIDTCSWQFLLTDKIENQLLNYLQKLSDNKHIKIVTHDIIIGEWNKNKILEKERLSKIIRTKYKYAKEIYSNEYIDIEEPDLRHIDKQIEIIDVLIDNALKLSTTNEVKILCSDKSLNGKAPYHNKKQSTPDAYIIYSALEYFQKSTKTFCFISDNKNDFADLDAKDRKIHPHILEEHEDCEIDYYVKIDRAINDFKIIFNLNISTTVVKSYSTQLSGQIPIDTSKSILDQIYDYLSIHYSQFNYIPANILFKHLPFRTSSNSSYPYYSVFTLYLGDLQLFELFESFINSNNREINVNEAYAGLNEEAIYKVNFILNSLRNNLIFQINYKNSNKQNIKINFNYSTLCSCAKCSFKRLVFSDFFNSIYDYTDSSEDLIEQGYMFYKMGNYGEAVNTFERAHNKAIENSHNSHAFIAKFNLAKLSSFIGNFWYDIQNRDEILKKLNSINLPFLLRKHRTKENRDVLEWISEEKFFTIYRNRIQEHKQKIVDQYHSSLNKGRSSNSYVQLLINDYAECNSFLESNKLIYDQFSEFYQLNRVFTEGLIASHSIQNSNNSRLLSFSDWILKQLVFNGDAEHIQKTARRYKLKEILYSSEDHKDTFVDLAVNFFNSDNSLWISNKEYKGASNQVFRDYFNRLYSNILILLSFCDLNRKFINDFVITLIKFHENNESIKWNKLKYLRFFLIKKGNIISLKNLHSLFKFGLYTGKIHEEDIIDVLSDIINSRKKPLSITRKDFKQIINLSFEECNICTKRHPNTIIVPILRMLANGKYKDLLIQRLKEDLRSDFKFDLYYQLQVYDLIEDDRTMFAEAMKCIPKKLKKMPQAFVFHDENIYRPLNDLINLCFKNNIDLKGVSFKNVKNLSPYYNWLIDMNNFNYENFEAEWITEYSTKFYFQRMAGSLKLKVTLENYLKENRNNLIEKYYLDIYIRRVWDKTN